MVFLRWALTLSCWCALAFSATFGTVVPMLAGAADIVLDEARGRLYLVNTAQNRVEVYSLAQRRFLSPIRTDGAPISGALSRSGKTLYVTAFDASALVAIDLDSLAVTSRVALPAKPEGVAVGSDERVLISTIGSGAGNFQNVLLIYDPSATGASAISNVGVTPPPPQPPQLPSPNGRQFLETRSQLVASADGNYIVGVNVPANTSRSVFLYEVSSGTVLRSRTVLNASSVLGVAPDGSKFMAGSTLFDAQTLQVLAQENLANAPYLVQPNTQFNTQTNQGGSVFSPDGSALYAAFDIAPVTNPPSRPNISQLMINNPDNLLIQSALQLPENLTGKMVISSDGGTIYALSESGFVIIPIGNMSQSPLAVPDNTAVLLANDQCGVTASQRSQRIGVFNAGKGRMSATAQVVQLNPTGPVGFGGGFGAGGGIIGGGGVIIILPPTVPGGGGVVVGPVIPGGPNPGTTNPAITQGAPQARSVQFPDGTAIDFTFNPLAARAPGTIPSHDFVIQSPEAINIPPRVRVYQNNHDAEARGDIIPVPVGISANEALEDLLYDPQRGRIYIANSGMNRVEVFDTRQKQFLTPIAVGQLPHSLALDGSTLYVANTGGESITIVDVDKLQATGRVTFPALAFNASSALVTPSAVAAGLRGPLVMMSNGILWQVVGNQAVPRPVSNVLGATNGVARAIAAPRSMAATPGGEYILVLGGDGTAYLYDALADDFVTSRQLTSLQQSTGGYFGPVTAGPRGQYFVVNGILLNQALTPVNAPQVPQRGGPVSSAGRPVAAVAPVSATAFARFTQPLRANNQLASDPGQVEIVDVNSGAPQRTVPSLEGPLSQALATGRPAVVEPRTMAVDANGNSAYMLTTSGLSIVPLDSATAPPDRPQVYANGAVNLASYQTTLDPNGLLSIFGRNLAGPDMASSTPLPNILGGVCVTANNQPLPLFMTSPGQINAQLGPDLKPGNYSIVVRSIDRHVAAAPAPVTLSKYAPAVFVDGNGQAAVLHSDGTYVTKERPAHRDEALVLYAVGLGPTTGAPVAAGNPAPSEPLAVLADKLQVYFGDPRLKQSEMIVEWAGLAPGLVGVYQVNVRVPGERSRGSALPVMLKVGGAQSPVAGPAVPVVAVD